MLPDAVLWFLLLQVLRSFPVRPVSHNAVPALHPAVNGKDLIGIGMQAGRGLGDILQKLLEEVLEEPQRNTKEFLLEEARRIQVKGSF